MLGRIEKSFGHFNFAFMIIKAVIIDFDNTITTTDMSSLYAGLVGKREESERLDRLFLEGKLKGLTSLVERINFLSGLKLDQLTELIKDNDYLRAGAHE